MSLQLLRHTIFAILLIAFAILAPVQAQPPADENEKDKQNDNVIVVQANGTEFFRDLLMKASFEPMEDPRKLTEQPNKTILVVFGSTQFLDNHFGDTVRDFLIRGGKLLICSDRQSGNGLLNLLSIKIVGTKLQAGNAKDAYLEDTALPYLRPFFRNEWQLDPASVAKVFLDPVMFLGPQGGRLALNYPTTLQHGAAFGQFDHTIEEFAGFPEGCQFRTQRTKFDPGRDFAALGGRYGRGHYLVLADTELFSNIMMIQEPLQNRDFAGSIVSWLREGEREKEPRTRCLFIEENEIQTRFDIIAGPGNIPWHVQLNYFLDQHANKLIYELEGKNFFNKILIGENGERFRLVLRGILFSLLTSVLLYGFFWMWKRRHKIDHSINEASNVIARIPQGGALQQRREALLENGNLFEAYRSRIRERFLTIGGGPDPDGKPPRIEVEDGVDDPREIRKRVLDLWDIAFGRKIVSVKANEWDAANSRLRRVLEESLKGRWRFEPSMTTT